MSEVSNMKSKTVIQLLVGLLLLFFVYKSINPSVFLKVSENLSVLSILGITFLLACTQFISACRWWLIASSGGINVSFRRAVVAFFMGMYANCFGLGTLGGDVVRGTLLGHEINKKTEAIASAFADRILGLFVLLSIGVFSILANHPSFADSMFLYTILALAFSLFIVWRAAPFILNCLSKHPLPFTQKLVAVSKIFHFEPKKLLIIVMVATIYHLLQIAIFWLIALSLGVQCSYSDMIVRVPFINIAATLPISWNGLGVRENAFVFFFTPLLMTQEQAVLVSMIWLVAMTLTSACGGVGGYLLVGKKGVRHLSKEF